MKHLVLSVTRDSSLDLLGKYADVILFDEGDVSISPDAVYETVYIRSHFSHPDTLPQKFQEETEALVALVRQRKQNVVFIDGMDTVDKIVEFEDKWHQYGLFSNSMPQTEVLGADTEITKYKHPVYKNRISSRGVGVTWNSTETSLSGDWIIQESMDIAEELRIYVIRGNVYPTVTVRQSKTCTTGTEAVGVREITQDEIVFSAKAAGLARELDIIGLDVARTTSGELYLLEANRSPGFGKFYAMTGINLADELYGSGMQPLPFHP